MAFAHVFYGVVMGLVNPHAGKDELLGIWMCRYCKWIRKCSCQDSLKRPSLKEIEAFIWERGIIKGIEKGSKAIREADLCAGAVVPSKEYKASGANGITEKSKVQAGTASFLSFTFQSLYFTDCLVMGNSETDSCFFLWSFNPILKFGVPRLQCLFCIASGMRTTFPTGRYWSSEKPTSTATKASKPSLILLFFPWIWFSIPMS